MFADGAFQNRWIALGPVFADSGRRAFVVFSIHIQKRPWRAGE